MDKEETTAPIPEEEKGRTIWKSEHPCLERTISEKKRTDRKTFLGRTAEETTRTTTKQY